MGSWSLCFGQVGLPSTLRSGRSLDPLARLERRVRWNSAPFARISLARVVPGGIAGVSPARPRKPEVEFVATEPSSLAVDSGVRSIVHRAVLASRRRAGLTLPQGPKSSPGV